MFISQLTSTSGFGELHFGEKMLTTVCATKEGGHSFCKTGQIGKLFTHIFCKGLQNCFQNISSWCPCQPAVQWVPILRAVFPCQIKRSSKQFQTWKFPNSAQKHKYAQTAYSKADFSLVVLSSNQANAMLCLWGMQSHSPISHRPRRPHSDVRSPLRT